MSAVSLKVEIPLGREAPNFRFGSLADIAAYSTTSALPPKVGHRRPLDDLADGACEATWLMALARASINFFEMQGNFGILPGIYRQMIRLMASSET